MNKKLTKRDIDNFSYSGGWDVRWDSAISGFGVRVYPSGKKAYVLSYRNEKRQKRLLTIAQTSKIPLDIARNKAIQHLSSITNNIDPAEERKLTSSGRNVESIFKDYLERYAKTHNKTWRETERIFNKEVLPVIGSSLIHEVEKKDVVKLIDAITDRGSHTMANRVLANLKRFFNWCIERGYIELSPADKLKKPTREISRDRVLSLDEIKSIWQACENESYPYGRLVQLLILTGQRKMEVTNIQWHEIDWNNAEWTLPKEKTKSNRSHTIPLSSLAITLLRQAKQHAPENSNFVFSTNGKTPFSGFSKCKKRLDNDLRENAGIENEWRLHDLRRSVASHLAALETPPHVIEKILNHATGTISGVAAVYNRYDYFKETRKALDMWAQSIETLVK